MQRLTPAPLLAFACLCISSSAWGQGDITLVPDEKTTPIRAAAWRLVEEFTANTLDQGEFKIGTDLEYGVTSQFMLGTDMVTTVLGAPTVQGKWAFWEKGPHRLAIGFRAAYLTKDTLLWGTVGEYYDDLKARMIRPQISWSHQLSPRLTLHTFWSKGFGTITAKLSEKGRRDLWEAKHPGSVYAKRDVLTQEPTSTPADSTTETSFPQIGSTANQEKKASERAAITTRTTQVQSIAGLAQDRFQITGEFIREGGNKILITSRIEQTMLEQLRSSAFRLSLAHQWIWSRFQMRIGFGAQYYSLSGRDLDGEIVSDAGVSPASDITFYLRF